MNSSECVVGIDIGGTTTSLGIIDRNGSILCTSVLETRPRLPAEDLTARLCDTVGTMTAAAPEPIIISAIGIGAPNANYLRGTVENPPNLNWGASVNLAGLFQQHFNVPVAVTNDANAAAIGELHFGGARGMSHVIVVTLGTGLGSGIIVDGTLLYGYDGFAGELGHTTVDPDGRRCACGKRGCLETYVSAPGICRTVLDLLAESDTPCRLREMDPGHITSKLIYEAAREGDSICLAAFDATARILGMKLADAVAHTSPEAIFLAGGLSAAGDLLIDPTRRYFEDFLFTPYKGKVALHRSSLHDNGAAVLGAAALAWSEFERMR